MLRIKSTIITCIIFLVLAASSIAAQAQSDSNSNSNLDPNKLPVSIDNCKLVLGWGSWPPYQWSNNDSPPQGLQITLVKQIAKQANCELSFVKQSFSENIEAVRNGSVDFIMDTSVTDYRKEFGHFTILYRFEAMVLYVKPDFIKYCQNKDIYEVLESGIKIGMNRGNIYGEEITKVQNDSKFQGNFVDSATNDGLYELFKSGSIDGFFEDPTVMAYNLRKKDMLKQLEACKVTQNSATVSFLFSKKTTEQAFVSHFNQAIEQVKQTKAYRELWSW